MRSDDLDPVFTTTAEVAAYMEDMEKNPFVPLYDVDGNVIGSFEVDVGHTGNDPEFAGLGIAAVQTKLANMA